MNGWIQIMLRSVFLFIISLIFIRIMGTRNVSKMTPINFVSYTVIAIIAALISVNIVTNLVFGLIALVVWIIFSVILDYLSLKVRWINEFINGKETVLIEHGKVMENNLMKVKLSAEELLKALRTKNVFNLADVEFAVMEATGDINVLPKSDKKPVTSHDLGRKVAPQAEPKTVIIDGKIQDDSLTQLGLDRRWLNTKLESLSVKQNNVFIGQVDSSGDLYLDLYDDSVQVPQPNVKEMLYASLEKSQADLMSFALETENKNAKTVYFKNADKLKQTLDKLEPYLLH